MPAIVSGLGFAAWAVAVLVVCIPRPALGRALLSALFGLMGLVNLVTAVVDPGSYQEAYAETALIPAYSDVITGFWAQHDAVLVAAVGVLQILMCVAVLLPGRPRRLGLVGMIVFLVAVAPTAFVNLLNLAFAAGAVLLLRADALERRRAASAPGPVDVEARETVDASS